MPPTSKWRDRQSTGETRVYEHGGARPGSGRRKELEGGKKVSLYLSDETVATATAIGKGNTSAGVRTAVDFFKEKMNGGHDVSG
jgi:hypothetical protein